MWLTTRTSLPSSPTPSQHCDSFNLLLLAGRRLCIERDSLLRIQRTESPRLVLVCLLLCCLACPTPDPWEAPSCPGLGCLWPRHHRDTG